jgi:DNA repair exonuclease SbcCD ATPase subunit
MEMDDYRERFLEAEMQAVDLVSQLEALKQEASHYRDAAGSLSKVRESLLSLMDKQDALVLGVKGVVDTLGLIGTSQIIDEINSIQTSISKQIGDTDKSVNEIINSNSAIQESINNYEKSFDEKTEALNKEIDSITTKLEISGKEQKTIRISVFVIGGLVLLFGLASTIQLILIR